MPTENAAMTMRTPPKHGDQPMPTVRVGDKHIQSGFGARLAHTDKKVRDTAVRSLIRWLRALDARGLDQGTMQREMKRLWNGLYYCFWMSDKPLIQQALAERLAVVQLHLAQQDDLSNTLLTDFDTDRYTVVLTYHFAFWNKIAKEWFGIDRIRLNKYYMLMRCMQRHFLCYLKSQRWDVRIIRNYAIQLAADGFYVPSDEIRDTMARPEVFTTKKRRRKMFRKIDRELREKKERKLLKMGIVPEQNEDNDAPKSTYEYLATEMQDGTQSDNNATEQEEDDDVVYSNDEEEYTSNASGTEGESEQGDDNEEEEEEEEGDEEEDGSALSGSQESASEVGSQDDEDASDDEAEEEQPCEVIDLSQAAETTSDFIELLKMMAATKALSPVPRSIRMHLVETFEETLTAALGEDSIDAVPEDSLVILRAVFNRKHD